MNGFIASKFAGESLGLPKRSGVHVLLLEWMRLEFFRTWGRFSSQFFGSLITRVMQLSLWTFCKPERQIMIGRSAGSSSHSMA